MKLTRIKEEQCPICRAEAEEESRNRRHCNGEYNESRTFACGSRIEFSPNYMSCSVAVECPTTASQVDLKMKQAATYLAVRKTIQDAECDDAFKQRMLSNITHYSYDLTEAIRKLTSS